MMGSRNRVLALTVAVGLLAAARGQAIAADCNPPPQGEGRAVAVTDPRSVWLQDGREIRLAGIEPALPRDAAIGALSALVVGRQLTLRGDSDMPDRYGRQPAFAFVDAETASVQRRLVADGIALVGTNELASACSAELFAAETAARRSGRGVWAESTAIKNAENPGDILTRIGRFTLVEGRVVSVREAGATVYLNFGRRWTRDFAVTISRRVGATFAARGLDLKSLANQRIRVRGWVERRGGPRIEVHQMGQIELPGGN